jgi:hypothetical protein
MLAEDPKEAVACMNPRLVGALGGAKSAERALTRTHEELARSGAKFLDVTVGEPGQPVVLKGREFVLVPETMRIRVNEDVLRQKGWLLAVREKDGAKWTFFDASPGLRSALANLYPDTPAEAFLELAIPAREPPVPEP